VKRSYQWAAWGLGAVLWGPFAQAQVVQAEQDGGGIVQGEPVAERQDAPQVPNEADGDGDEARPAQRFGVGQGRGPGGGRGRGFGMGQGRGQGQGRGRGPGMGRGQAEQAAPGHSHDDRHDEDREVFHFLLANHEKIKRTVVVLPDGVETVTESEDKAVADKIKEHVHWMEDRVKNTNPIRMRDPLFAELFRQTDKIKMVHETTEHGVRVTETSDDPYVAKLIQAHAEVVSRFVRHGFTESHKNHAVPPRDGVAPPAVPARLPADG